MEINGAKVPIVLQNILLCVQQKKENLHFGVEYPFKSYFHWN